jgi:hypothetical protein
MNACTHTLFAIVHGLLTLLFMYCKHKSAAVRAVRQSTGYNQNILPCFPTYVRLRKMSQIKTADLNEMHILHSAQFFSF